MAVAACVWWLSGVCVGIGASGRRTPQVGKKDRSDVIAICGALSTALWSVHCILDAQKKKRPVVCERCMNE